MRLENIKNAALLLAHKTIRTTFSVETSGGGTRVNVLARDYVKQFFYAAARADLYRLQ